MTPDQAEVEELELDQMAQFCLVTGLPPSVYWSLKVEEYEAIVRVHNRNQKEANKRG